MMQARGWVWRLAGWGMLAWWGVLLVAMAIAAKGQSTGPTTPVLPTPNCIINFQFTATGTAPQFNAPIPDAFDNRNQGCTAWIIAYSNSGFSALSLVAQVAPNTSGIPGAWSTFPALTGTGSNPNTATTSAMTQFFDYYPWVRVNLSSATGSGIVQGTMYGWKNQPVSVVFQPAGGGAITSIVWGPDDPGITPTENPVQVSGVDPGGLVRRIATDTSGRSEVVGGAADGASAIGINPVVIGVLGASNLARQLTTVETITDNSTGGRSLSTGAVVFDGTNYDRDFACTSQAAVTLAAGTNVVIVAAAVGKTTRICHLSFTMDSTQTILIRQGTGTTCGSTTTNLSGTYQSALGLAGLFLDFGAVSALRDTTTNVDTCLQFGGSVTIGGTVIYGQF